MSEQSDGKLVGYYVSVVNGPQRSLITGPYDTLDAASAEVSRVRLAAIKVTGDHMAWHYDWGCARVVNDLLPQGRLNEQIGLTAPAPPEPEPCPITEAEARQAASSCCGPEFLEMVERGIVVYRSADRGRQGGYYVGDLLVNVGGPDGRYHRIIPNGETWSTIYGRRYPRRDGGRVELTPVGRDDLTSERARLAREAARAER